MLKARPDPEPGAPAAVAPWGGPLGAPALLGVLVVMVAAAWVPVLRDLVDVWSRRPEASHGFLVLPASLYFAWVQRDRLRRLAPRPVPWLGLPLLALAAAAMRVGEVAGIVTVSSVALVVSAVALVLTLLGPAHLKALRFPLAFLLFMTPIVDDPLDPLHWPLQRATAEAAAAALSALGIPSFVHAQYIVLPRITLEVAEACSGVGLFVSIVTVALAAAYLMLRRKRSWVVLVGAALLIGIVANWLRVAIIGVWAQMGGEVVHGPLHVFQAMSAAVVAYLGVGVIAWVLARREARHPVPSTAPTGPPAGGVRRAAGVGAGIAAGVVLVFLVLDAHTYLMGVRPVPIREPLATFPAVLGPWHGAAKALEEAPFRLGGADPELFRHYEGPDGCGADLYVAYLPVQRQGAELVNFRTARLHRGAGVTAFPAGADTLAANVGTVAGRGGEAVPMVFWYEVDGVSMAGRYPAMRRNLVGALTRRRNDGALVMLSGRAGANTARAGAWERCLRDGGLVERLVPALRLHL